jgi:hypothetical protein
VRRVLNGWGFAEYEQRGSFIEASRVSVVLSRDAIFVSVAISLEAMLPGQSRQLRRHRSLDRTSHTGRPKAVNDQQHGLPAAASILKLGLQLFHRLSNGLARMGDVYFSHGATQ